MIAPWLAIVLPLTVGEMFLISTSERIVNVVESSSDVFGKVKGFRFWQLLIKMSEDVKVSRGRR